jgi:predicted GH43/DUF377 family glycosyl hydrolase
MSVSIRHHPIVLSADAAKVVLRPFAISAEPDMSAMGAMSRAERICRSLLQLTREDCTTELELLTRDFLNRHYQAREIFLERFHQVRAMIGRQIDGVEKLDTDHAALIGAHFCHEYSHEAAAVMNPSVTVHPDQTDVPEGAVRFIMSIRAVGEGHISSIVFREGLFHEDGSMVLLPEPDFLVTARPEHPATDGPVTLVRDSHCTTCGTVLFPTTRAQRNGLEDLRMVQFTEDDGRKVYLGTYTAYSGREVGCELFETADFNTFHLTPLDGVAAVHKGLALFPRRINGRYAAIGRLDHECLYYMESEDPLNWNFGERILKPHYPWERIQMGNCGSPIELDEGWLVLTHGVGAMRRYCLGAVLLDKDDPRQVLGRSREPLLSPAEDTREGYVPNVIYSCGAIRHGDWLFLPYGVADSSIRFASIKIADILQHLRKF